MNFGMPAGCLLTMMLIASNAAAEVDVRQDDAVMFPDDVEYDPSIPTPASVLGFELGAEPVRHHQLVDYITTVAGLSDRLSVETIGYSHERRPILFVVATSPGNHARLDDVRARHVALTEPAEGQPVPDDMPVVSWINYGVHGAESSGMDAALPFVYYLAAARGDGIERLLADSVILITAVFNPDGHSQRVAWFDAYGGQRAISDPAHIEHDYSWQFARTNHYFFDLNRQWLLLTQPEPQAWVRKWQEWRPNISVDYHEMGSASTYYFHPGVAARDNPLIPDAAAGLLARLVRDSETFLDSEARLYFHGEVFDNFYIGKGSTYPLVNGAIGVLFEAGAALGRELETDSGLRTYRENIRKHFRTSLASAEGAARLRPELLRYQKTFYEEALDDAAQQQTQAWVFSADGDAVRLNTFVELLAAHRIDVHRLGRDIVVDGNRFAAADSLIVPVTQPQHRLIRSIFETLTEFEDATFYDVSTWTLPPAFGLRYAALERGELRGDTIATPHTPFAPTAPVPARSSYGYAFDWKSYNAPRALQRVLEFGLHARTATEPFVALTADGVASFGRGSIFVPLDRQSKSRESIHELIREIAANDGVRVRTLNSGRSARGTQGRDLGGPSFRALELPSTLLVVGRDIDLYDAGEIWHLLDYRMDMPVTLRDRTRLDDIDWSRYTHVVFPGGDYDDYAPEYLDRLRLWVEEGGTLIGLRDAAPWVRASTIDYVDPDADTSADADADADAERSQAPERVDYEDKKDREAAEVVGGAIFAADLDVSHPLGFGYENRGIFLHKNRREVMKPTENPYATVIAYTEDPVYSGYVSAENAEALAGTSALIAERVGDGSVVLFADNPNFRGYWYGTNKLFLNALFFSRVFDAQAEEPADQ